MLTTDVCPASQARDAGPGCVCGVCVYMYRLWKRTVVQEGHGKLSWFIPQPLRCWVMSNYAVHALGLYDSDSDDEDDVEEELETEREEAVAKELRYAASDLSKEASCQPGGKADSMHRVSSSNTANSSGAGTVRLVEFSPDEPLPAAGSDSTAQGTIGLQPPLQASQPPVEHQVQTLRVVSGITATTGAQQDVDGVVGSAQVTVTVETGSPRSMVLVAHHPTRSAGQLWGLVRAAVLEGRVKALIRSKRYRWVGGRNATIQSVSGQTCIAFTAPGVWCPCPRGFMH